MSNSAIEIKDRAGKVKRTFFPCAQTGKIPSWSTIFLDLALENQGQLRDYDFSSAIKEQLTLSRIIFEDCVLDFEDLKRSAVTECIFRNVTIRQTSFHHLADRSDRAESRGTLFRGCRFERVKFFRCDFVMSKFFECEFVDCEIIECDMRNVYWFDRFATEATIWDELPNFPDPFKGSTLKKTRFGHPAANMMGVPLQMMIPRSFTSIWEHLGPIKGKMLKLGYAFREEGHDAFHSSI